MIPIYQTTRRISLMESATATPNWNLPMNRSDFKIQRDVWNEVEFVVRNTDRKPISLVDKYARILIQDLESQAVLLQQDLTAVDEAKGVVKLSLMPHITTGWPTGFLAYSVTLVNPDGTEKSLMMDHDQRSMGYLELVEGMAPPFPKSIEVTSFTPIDTQYGQKKQFITGALQGASQSGCINTLHTVAIYADHFTGRVWVEASLENQAPTQDSEWFKISLTSATDYWSLDRASGIQAFNFTTSARWVRLRFEPHKTNTGKIERLLFKN